ncbi:MAG: 50S ribosomal protein L10 [bacterium]|nr:50S ribosomal protein L10 [bacterium]
MKKQEKIYAVENLTEQIRDAKSIFLTDYRGLTVSQISDLRSQIKKSGGQMSVVKNTLLTRALANLKLELPKEDLEGPTAVVIALDDELAPLKAVANFAKAAGLPSFKSGIINDRALTSEEIKTLSLLPSRNELVAKLMGILLSPTHRFIGVISNNPRKLIILLKKMEESANRASAQTKVEEKVEEGGSAPTEVPSDGTEGGDKNNG